MNRALTWHCVLSQGLPEHLLDCLGRPLEFEVAKGAKWGQHSQKALALHNFPEGLVWMLGLKAVQLRLKNDKHKKFKQQ